MRSRRLVLPTAALLLASMASAEGPALAPEVRRYVAVDARQIVLAHVRVIDGTGAPAKASTRGAIFESFLEGTTPENAQVVDPANLPGGVFKFDMDPNF